MLDSPARRFRNGSSELPTPILEQTDMEEILDACLRTTAYLAVSRDHHKVGRLPGVSAGCTFYILLFVAWSVVGLAGHFRLVSLGLDVYLTSRSKGSSIGSFRPLCILVARWLYSLVLLVDSLLFVTFSSDRLSSKMDCLNPTSASLH